MNSRIIIYSGVGLICVGIIAAARIVSNINGSGSGTSESLPQATSSISPSKPEPESPPQLTALSQRAANLRSGMTHQQVVNLLGRSPNTVYREADLLSYEWQNDSSLCPSVKVQFRGSQVTGWDEGRACGTEPSKRNQPYGESCKNNPLCKM